MKAEILTIGDELLRGEIVDSNKSFLSDRLLQLDIETRFHTTVADDTEDIQDAFRQAVSRSDVVLVSGGLGPTRDDITVAVLAETFGRSLLLDEPSLAELEAFFRRLGREMSELNRKQAYFPEGAEILANPIGTAPGCMVAEADTLIFCMPGVPRELYRMMDEQVLPRIASRMSQGLVVRARLLRTFGIGESNLDEELGDIARDDPDVSLGFRTSFPDNYLRPVVRALDEGEAAAKLDAVCEAIRARLGDLIYGEGEVSLPEVVGEALVTAGKTLATAESCTGGLIAQRMTDIPGSSRYFLGGVAAYANEAKRELLGVDELLLKEHGAVSEPVARAMAEGARARFGADIAVSTTGISGPGGGSEEKPVGLVWMALADASGIESHDYVIRLDRSRHRELTAQLAIDWVRRRLMGVPRAAPRFLARPGSKG
mgnify:CR=1 FL=1